MKNLKKSIALLSLLIFSVLFANAQNPWHWIMPMPTGNHYLKITSFGKSGIAVVGKSGTISISDNDGKTWKTWHYGNSDFNDVVFINEKTGFVVGDNGMILKTTDAGQSWKEMRMGYVDNLNSIRFSGKTGFICGDNGFVLKSKNRGKKWKKMDRPSLRNLNSIGITDGKIFIAGDSGTLLTSTNKGKTFVKFDKVILNANFNEITFYNKNLGLMASNKGLPIIMRTTDGGATWAPFPAGPKQFVCNTVGFADSVNTFMGGNYGLFSKSADGGKNWQKLPMNLFTDINSLHFKNGRGYACGQNGYIYTKEANSDDWDPVNGRHDYRLTTINFSGSNGIIAGERTAFRKEGSTSVIPLEISPAGQQFYVSDISSVGDYTYISTWEGYFIRSNNNGKTWSVTKALAPGKLMSVDFVTAKTGFVFSNDGLFHMSNDSGITWITDTIAKNFTLESGQMITASKGFAVGHRGGLYKTEDAGTSWKKYNADTMSYFMKIWFLDAKTGWIAGSKGIMYTVDGGNSWIPVSLPTNEVMLAVKFKDPMNGLIAGTNGSIFRSADGGKTWIAEPGFSNAALYDIGFDGNLWWICGDNGMLVNRAPW